MTFFFISPVPPSGVVLLTVSFVFHVVSAALWTGATLYFVYATLPAAKEASISARAFADQAHRLLLITRWTGIVLPITGGYMIWELYTPLSLLTTTTRGWAVLAMIGLWGLMNSLIELGVLRMRHTIDDVGLPTYMQEGFPATIVPAETSTDQLLAAGRPSLLASAVCAVLLLVDAALLAGGFPM